MTTPPMNEVKPDPYYKDIGPRSGLISEEHHNVPDLDGWWRGAVKDDTRWVIPDLWPWGHMPMLTGQPKAGKSSAVVDLTASLLMPGRKFLDHFEPSNLTEDDRSRGIVLINAETPKDALIDELMGATEGDTTARQWLEPIHLEESGGAATFDLTEPSLFDEWVHRLVKCNDCDRTDDWSPSVVIVDGLTAILQAAGKGVEHYGLWYAKFRLLMTELRVPNALVVGHSTLTGNHSMGGTEALAGPDGLWVYASDNVDNPRASRRLSVTPRMGGAVVPPLRVELSEAGRPVVVKSSPAKGDAEGVAKQDQSPDPQEEAEAYVREVLAKAGSTGMRKTEITGSGRYAKPKREAVDRMVARGELVSQPEGQGFRYWLAEAVS